MVDPPEPVLQTADEIALVGVMAVYDSPSEASDGIPQQWRSFLTANPSLRGSSQLYGASPCTSDGKIHYLAGVRINGSEPVADGEHLSLAAGEYAVIQVDEPARLRDTWGWLLGTWLPSSGRMERHAPEFERYLSISEAGAPLGTVEIWIPLESLANK